MKPTHYTSSVHISYPRGSLYNCSIRCENKPEIDDLIRFTQNFAETNNYIIEHRNGTVPSAGPNWDALSQYWIPFGVMVVVIIISFTIDQTKAPVSGAGRGCVPGVDAHLVCWRPVIDESGARGEEVSVRSCSSGRRPAARTNCTHTLSLRSEERRLNAAGSRDVLTGGWPAPAVRPRLRP